MNVGALSIVDGYNIISKLVCYCSLVHGISGLTG